MSQSTRRVIGRILARGAAVALLPTLFVNAAFAFMNAPGLAGATVSFRDLVVNVATVGLMIAGVTSASSAVEVLVPRGRRAHDVAVGLGCCVAGALAAVILSAQFDYARSVLGGHAAPLEAAALASPSRAAAVVGGVAGGVLGVGGYLRRRGHDFLVVFAASMLALDLAQATLFVIDARPGLGRGLEALAAGTVPASLLGIYVTGVTAMVDDLLGDGADRELGAETA